MDCITLFVSTISTICIISKYNLIYCSYFVGGFCIFDLYFVIKIKKIDIIIHHLFVITMIYFLFLSKVDNTVKILVIKPLLSTEISTNFLILKNTLSANRFPSKVVLINNLLFVATFLYYRIFNFFIKIIISKEVFYIMATDFTWLQQFFLFFSIYGLFTLNLYWSVLILKKCYSLVKR
jgi:hypothetical protein